MTDSIKHFPSTVSQDDQQQGRGPLMSGVKVHNGVAYISGKGARGERDIQKATTQVLDAIQADLERVGSSMDHALKVTVFLDDLNDFAAMNDAYRGRFGGYPPVRSTVACYGGIPGDSIIEVDCIAAVD